MSILIQKDDVYYISHSKYIESIYSNVNSDPGQNFKLNNHLFAIHSPYLRSNQKDNRKTPKKDTVLETLSDDCKFVISMFEKFKKNCDINLIDKNPVDDSFNNLNAKEEAEKSYCCTSTNHFLDSSGGNLNLYPIIYEIGGVKYLIPSKSNFHCKNINLIDDWIDKEGGQFDLIVLDPPWWNKYIRRKKRKVSDHSYQMMNNEDLKNIPINKLLSTDGFVIVWCTNSKSHEKAIINDFFPKWKVKFLAKWFWLKVTTTGEPICEFSEPPGKQPFELIIVGCHENCIPKTSLANKLVISVPSALHSHKPPLVKLIEPFLIENPKCLEIFARYLLPNWTSWGLEVCRLQNLCLYENLGQL